MDKIGEILIIVTGKTGKIKLTPESYDIKYIVDILQNVENLLFPENKKNRPLITYDIQKGSVKHIFKTSFQTVIGFNAVLHQISQNGSIDFLQLKTARAFESFQKISVQKNYDFEITTSVEPNSSVIITPKTKFYRTEDIWVDAEFYFYGVLKDAGGKNNANIHIDTKDYGYLIIETNQKFLAERTENLLYKKFGVRAIGKQNIETGEIDTHSLKLIELIDYNPDYDESYLKKLITKAKNSWKGVDTDRWLIDLRGDYE